jgi:hypothetical protein
VFNQYAPISISKNTAQKNTLEININLQKPLKNGELIVRVKIPSAIQSNAINQTNSGKIYLKDNKFTVQGLNLLFTETVTQMAKVA